MPSLLRKTLIVIGAAIVILAVAVFFITRPNRADYGDAELTGTDPIIAEPEEESFPSLGLIGPIGWADREAPVAADGLQVNRFAEGLDHPRSMLVLPNGDLLVAETNSQPREGGGIEGVLMRLFMSEVDATAPSADRITLLRDGNGDGAADQSFVLLEDLKSPFGMALHDGQLLVANTDAVLSFPYTVGDTRIDSEGSILMELPGNGHHWTRNLLFHPTDERLYVAVGSASNIGEYGMEAEKDRAAILEYDFATGERRRFASGLRNPTGLAFNPDSGELWTTVNERDMLGPDGPLDYLTNVPIGTNYGWPWLYWRHEIDDRVEAPMPEFLKEYTRRPEYSMGAHVAALGLVFADKGSLGVPFEKGAIVARHGSWNRVPPSGFDVVFVPFDDRGNPLDGPVRPLLTGFLASDKKTTHGRPTWLAWAGDGALLVSDDTAGIIWRVSARGAKKEKAKLAD